VEDRSEKLTGEKPVTLVVGADHAGYELKKGLCAELAGLGVEFQDLGAHTLDPLDDYPDFAARVGEAVGRAGATRGIVVCGSGVGVCIALNKHPGVRAGICHDTYSAHQGVEHDDMNVLCLGSRIVSSELARAIVKSFVDAQFSVTEERHLRRLEKVRELEKRYFRGPTTD
jgi:ribose 5-phosphate isomerase B